MTSVRDHLQPRRHGYGPSGLHGLLHARMHRSERHDDPRDYDQVERPCVVVEGFLPGVERKSEVAVSHVFGVRQPTAIHFRHDGRFAQDDAHPDVSFGSCYLSPLQSGQLYETVRKSNHNHCNNSSCHTPVSDITDILSVGERAVNTTNNTPHTTTVAT